MKEKLYTIPLNDAVNENDECPFCFIERKLEQDMINFVLGSSSSYMESDIREQTDKIGFCRTHMKKMFDYGNTLGNSLILKTHYQKLQKEFQEQIKHFTPGKVSLTDRLEKTVLRQQFHCRLGGPKRLLLLCLQRIAGKFRPLHGDLFLYVHKGFCLP